jgi:acyl-CoA synthetase (NDP forming)
MLNPKVIALVGATETPDSVGRALMENLASFGGPGVLATDMLVREGGKIAQLSDPSFQKLNALLPKYWSRNNPDDVLGDATTDRFVKTVEIVSADPDNDGILVIVTPQGMTDPTAIAKGLEPFRKLAGKPILASWMGASAVADGEAILNAEDEPLMVKFHSTLSEDSVQFRYFGFLKLEQRTTHERLTRICFNDYRPRDGHGWNSPIFRIASRGDHRNRAAH